MALDSSSPRILVFPMFMPFIGYLAIFSLLHNGHAGSGTHPTSFTIHTMISLGGKAGHSPLFNAEGRNTRAIPLLAHIVSWHDAELRR
jgi:hypothetical protein